MADAILTAHKLKVSIAQRTLCRNLNFQLASGQCWCLLGRNGAGKTILLHTLAGLLLPASGRILLAGQDITRWKHRALARQLGLLLQQHVVHFPVRVIDVVLAGRYPHLGPWCKPSAKDWELAITALAKVGLAGLELRLLPTLSGGERQRVYLAALLTQDPKILLLDEPISHLDVVEQYKLLRLLRELADQGHAVLMSLHDINQALRVCDHLLLLHKGHALTGSVSRLGTARLLSRILGIPLTKMDGPQGRLFIPY